MIKRHPPGENWDAEKIRREREFGWFRQHEADLIEAARRVRRRLEEAEAQRRAAKAEALLQGPAPGCPRCGREMRRETISEIQVARCPHCDGVFLDRRELELLLLKRDEERRWFFRKFLETKEH